MDKLQKIVIGMGTTFALGILGLIGVLSVDSYQYAVKQKMQQRQDSITAMMNYNSLTRISDVNQYKEIYDKTQEVVDRLKIRMDKF